MAGYTVGIALKRDTQDFLKGRCSRRQRMRFDGGAEVPRPSSPPKPMRTGIRCEPVPGDA